MEAVDNSPSSTAAGYVEIAIAGAVDTMNLVSASVAAGDNLIISTTAGVATVVGTPTADVRVIGQCLTDGGSDQGSGIIFPHPMFAGLV
jgi:hypothetical protein